MTDTNITRDEAAERSCARRRHVLRRPRRPESTPDSSASTTFPSTTTVHFTASPGRRTWIDLIAPSRDPRRAQRRRPRHLDLHRHPAPAPDPLARQPPRRRGRLPLHAHRRGPAPVRRPGRRRHLPLHAVRGRRRPPHVRLLRPARPQGRRSRSPSPRRPTGRSCRTPPRPSPPPAGGDLARWDFAATPRISTYITALVAGPYHVVRDEYVGPHGTYPLGVFCRASLAATSTPTTSSPSPSRASSSSRRRSRRRTRSTKYDQLFVPEFNAGAMENAGCVTILEDYVFRSRVTDYAYEAARQHRSCTSSRTCGSATSSP